jgi:rhodanese-related sulfurtransferase
MNEYIAPQHLQHLREAQQTAATPTVIDVRDAEEYAAGHIPGAQHIPLDELAGRRDEVPRGRPVVSY